MPEWNALASQPDDTVPLLETALLIARDEYPDLDPDLYDTLVQSHAEHLRHEIATIEPWPLKMAAINRHLFDERLGEALTKARELYDADPKRFEQPEQVRARHILIGPANDEQARQKANEVLAQAKAPGADFAALARQHSQDLASAREGGDLGLFSRDKMVPAFTQAAFALQAGELSPVVATLSKKKAKPARKTAARKPAVARKAVKKVATKTSRTVKKAA